MKTLKWIIAFIAFVLLCLIAFRWYVRTFPKLDVTEMGQLEVTEKKMGPYVYAFQEYVGPHKNVKSVVEDVKKTLAGRGIETAESICVYFDNPALVPADKLRSNCGNVIKLQDADKADAASQAMKVAGFVLTDCIVAEFPLKNSFSYMVGPGIAYPALAKYAKAKGYTIRESYEVYDEAGKKISYFIPVSK